MIVLEMLSSGVAFRLRVPLSSWAGKLGKGRFSDDP
jgi:hypothetical protein